MSLEDYEDLEGEALAAEFGEPRCRECGCSEFEPCADPHTGICCHWIEDDLCSFCLLADVAVPTESPLIWTP